jgi:hypothetical protein
MKYFWKEAIFINRRVISTIFPLTFLKYVIASSMSLNCPLLDKSSPSLCHHWIEILDGICTMFAFYVWLCVEWFFSVKSGCKEKLFACCASLFICCQQLLEVHHAGLRFPILLCGWALLILTCNPVSWSSMATWFLDCVAKQNYD